MAKFSRKTAIPAALALAGVLLTILAIHRYQGGTAEPNSASPDKNPRPESLTKGIKIQGDKDIHIQARGEKMFAQNEAMRTTADLPPPPVIPEEKAPVVPIIATPKAAPLTTEKVVQPVAASVAKDPLAEQKARNESLRNVLKLPALKGAVFCEIGERGFQVTFLKDRHPPETQIKDILADMTGDTGDADRYLKLASLYKDGSQEQRTAGMKAAALLRQKLKEDPSDTDVALCLGVALHLLGEKKEGESLVRGVVKKTPSNYRGWLVMGQILKGRAYEALPLKKGWSGNDLMRDNSKLFSRIPSQQEVETSMALFSEGASCFDRAVELEPSEDRTYMDQLVHRGRWLTLQRRIDLERGLQPKHRTTLEIFAEPANVADTEKAAALRPSDLRAILCRSFVVACAVLLEKQKYAHPSPELTTAWTKRMQREFERSESGLLALTKDADKRTAAEAAECLGFLCGLYSPFFDVSKEGQARRWLRQAVDSDEASDGAWLGAIQDAFDNDGETAAIALCEKRLRQADSARFHYLLATYRRFQLVTFA